MLCKCKKGDMCPDCVDQTPEANSGAVPGYGAWILVTDKLPLEEYRGERVFTEVLAVVELDEKDEHDEPKVTPLKFTSYDMQFKSWINGKVYGNHGWHVTKWMPFPGAL